ncbi:hypothetical protein FRC11_009717, partial [Ceratobasidium sp. 423]
AGGVNFISSSSAETISEAAGGQYDIVSWDPRRVGHTVPRADCFKTRTEKKLSERCSRIGYWANKPAHEMWRVKPESTDEAFIGFVTACAAVGPSACALATQNSTPESIRKQVLDLIGVVYDHKREFGPKVNYSPAALRFTPALFGAGMISGMNASWSFFGGFVLAWGIIAPSLIATGGAVGRQRAPAEFPEVWSYQAMSFKTIDDYIHASSPRYWLLWPGVLIMLVYSFAEMFMSSRGAFKSFGKIGSAIMNSIRNIRTRGDPNTIHHQEDNDPLASRTDLGMGRRSCHQFDHVLCSLGRPVLTQRSFLRSVCTTLASSVPYELTSARTVLGFIFSFIGVQSSGYTDINPVSTVAKASQLIFGGVTKGTGVELKAAREVNLVAGIIAAGSAAQACDMTGDLKTGHLLRAKPKNQFVAQVTGSIVSVFLGVGLFVLFTKASPCILYPPDDGICSYGAPSVAAWQAVATAVTADKLPIPPASGYTAIGLSVTAIITVLVKHLWIPRKYWSYVPNWNAVGLAFVVPQTYFGTAMAAGATFNYIWERRNPRTFDMYMFPISAGMIAGEGLGGVLLALLSVAGFGADGVKYGTSVGCT